MIVLYTDSDCDITLKEANDLGFKLISMPYIIGEEVYYPYQTLEEFDYHSFYNKLREGIIPKTSAISPGEYMNYFESEFEKGNDILYVHFSKAMSGTFNSMNIALEELYEKYPGRKLYTIDTKAISIGSRAIVKEVSRLYNEGASINEILTWAEKEVDKYAVYFYADDLKFFAKSGRVSGLAAFMGGLIGIHPIIHMDSDGMMKSISKARGKKMALKKVLDYVITLQDDIKSHQVIIAHSDNLELAQTFSQMMKDEFGSDLDIEITCVNPTAGSHCGPNNIGVSFHAKHR